MFTSVTVGVAGSDADALRPGSGDRVVAAAQPSARWPSESYAVGESRKRLMPLPAAPVNQRTTVTGHFA
jgi:hypothetical protein